MRPPSPPAYPPPQATKRKRHDLAPNTVTSGTRSSASHVVLAISENLARETSICCIDMSVPTEMTVLKQANSQTYAETLTGEFLFPPSPLKVQLSAFQPFIQLFIHPLTQPN